MNADSYREVARLARDWVRGLFPRPIRAPDISRIRAGVGLYLACQAGGQLHYIGSVVRPNDSRGIAKRISQHPRKVRAKWWLLWVLPLRDDTPRNVVLSIEGQAIDLLNPPGNRRKHFPRAVPFRKE